MDPRLILPPAAGSPWADWARPDMRHCEANGAGWIAAPADTWSNLAFLAAAAYLLTRKSASERALGAVSVAVGVTSFVFHASYTSQGQFLDYAGMFLLTGWILARGLRRAGAVKNENAAWAGLVVLSLALFPVFRALGLGVQNIMLAEVLLSAGLEARLKATGRGAPRYADFGLALGLIAIAYAFWHMDHSDRFCDPENHLFQWHAAWHVLNAIAFVPLARFYRDEAAGRA